MSKFHLALQIHRITNNFRQTSILMKHSLLLLTLIIPSLCNGQIDSKALDDLADKYTYQSFDKLKELLSIPNDAHFPEDIEKNIQWCIDEFGSRGFTMKRLETPTVPLLLAERTVDNPQKTVLIYLQVDGQPVDSTKWQQESPWIPALKEKTELGTWKEIEWRRIYSDYDPEWRVFARSASDAKGPVVMFLAALDAIEEIGKNPSYNIKVIMDFEEELGSPHLPDAVSKYDEELASDLLIIFDGPLHISNEPSLKFGARGIATITLTTYGPIAPQHSGHYGNYAPNPAVRMSQLIASMKSDDGRVTIPGFYDGVVIDEDVRKILESVPDDEMVIQKRIGIAEPDAVGKNYQEAIQYPSLNVRGFSSGWVGDEVRTIVPATATAEIDVRLVKESDPERLLQLIKNHIKDQGYYITSGEPTEKERDQYPRILSWSSEISYRAFRTPTDSDVGIWLSNALKKAHGKEPIKIRTSGGSIPISPFVTTLGIPAVSVPTVNMDNNQHSPNENIRLGNYRDGIETMIAVLLEEFKE